MAQVSLVLCVTFFIKVPKERRDASTCSESFDVPEESLPVLQPNVLLGIIIEGEQNHCELWLVLVAIA